MTDQITINGRTFWLVTCYTCKVPFAMDDATHASAMRGKEEFTFHCPFGHAQHYISGEHPQDILRRERDLLKQRLACRDDEIRDQRNIREHAERSASAYKGQVTRLKRRAAAGVCPCCNRHFVNLQRHMEGQHPEFREEKEA